MMISTKGRYALRIMIDLAQHDSDVPVSVREIADRQDISGKYMEQIIGVLTRAGLLRSVRGAQVSEKHAGFIVNTGGATATDILALIDLVQREVEERFGVRLETEVRVLGED